MIHIIIKGELNLSSLKAYVWNARPATVRCKGEQKVRNEGVMRITKMRSKGTCDFKSGGNQVAKFGFKASECIPTSQ